MKKTKEHIFKIIQVGSKDDLPSRLFDIFIVIVIFLNLFATFFGTFKESAPYTTALNVIDSVTCVIFTIEYILRIWTAEYLYPGKTHFGSAFRFIFSFYGIVDLLTFLPFYMPLFLPAGLVAFRIFRVIRIFRLFRINAQYDAFNVIIDVINEKKNQLISSMCIVIIFMLATSMCMYSIEHAAQPDIFENAFSGIWWATSTLLTVGYGDVYPVTTLGKMLAIIISFLGVGLVAIPTGIISASFVERYSSVKNGGNINDKDLNFLTPTITESHSWVGCKYKDIILPPQMEIINVFRNGEPQSFCQDDTIQAGDELVLYYKK